MQSLYFTIRWGSAPRRGVLDVLAETPERASRLAMEHLSILFGARGFHLHKPTNWGTNYPSDFVMCHDMAIHPGAFEGVIAHPCCWSKNYIPFLPTEGFSDQPQAADAVRAAEALLK